MVSDFLGAAFPWILIGLLKLRTCISAYAP